MQQAPWWWNLYWGDYTVPQFSTGITEYGGGGGAHPGQGISFDWTTPIKLPPAYTQPGMEPGGGGSGGVLPPDLFANWGTMPEVPPEALIPDGGIPTFETGVTEVQAPVQPGMITPIQSPVMNPDLDPGMYTWLPQVPMPPMELPPGLTPQQGPSDSDTPQLPPMEDGANPPLDWGPIFMPKFPGDVPTIPSDPYNPGIFPPIWTDLPALPQVPPPTTGGPVIGGPIPTPDPGGPVFIPKFSPTPDPPGPVLIPKFPPDSSPIPVPIPIPIPGGGGGGGSTPPVMPPIPDFNFAAASSGAPGPGLMAPVVGDPNAKKSLFDSYPATPDIPGLAELLMPILLGGRNAR
jgi:hypothetical protein